MSDVVLTGRQKQLQLYLNSVLSLIPTDNTLLREFFEVDSNNFKQLKSTPSFKNLQHIDRIRGIVTKVKEQMIDSTVFVSLYGHMFKTKGNSFVHTFGDGPGMIKNNSFKQLIKKNTSFSTSPTRKPSSSRKNSFRDGSSNINSNYAISSSGVSSKSNSFRELEKESSFNAGRTISAETSLASIAESLPRQMILFHEHTYQIWTELGLMSKDHPLTKQMNIFVNEKEYIKSHLRITPRTKGMVVDILTCGMHNNKHNHYIKGLNHLAMDIGHMMKSMSKKAVYPMHLVDVDNGSDMNNIQHPEHDNHIYVTKSIINVVNFPNTNDECSAKLYPDEIKLVDIKDAKQVLVLNTDIGDDDGEGKKEEEVETGKEGESRLLVSTPSSPPLAFARMKKIKQTPNDILNEDIEKSRMPIELLAFFKDTEFLPPPPPKQPFFRSPAMTEEQAQNLLRISVPHSDIVLHEQKLQKLRQSKQK